MAWQIQIAVLLAFFALLPFIAILFIPGVRSWAVVATLYVAFIFLNRCEISGSVDCAMGLGLSAYPATAVGAALAGRGIQFALPWQSWWIRVALAVLAIPFVWWSINYLWWSIGYL